MYTKLFNINVGFIPKNEYKHWILEIYTQAEQKYSTFEYIYWHIECLYSSAEYIRWTFEYILYSIFRLNTQKWVYTLNSWMFRLKLVLILNHRLYILKHWILILKYSGYMLKHWVYIFKFQCIYPIFSIYNQISVFYTQFEYIYLIEYFFDYLYSKVESFFGKGICIIFNIRL